MSRAFFRRGYRREYYYYEVNDPEIRGLVSQASDDFQSEKEDANFSKSKEIILSAIKLMESKLEINKDPNNHSDLAFLYRRLATILVRDYRNNNYASEAKAALERALSLFDGPVVERSATILVEQSRTLHQLRAVAYIQKDGTLLETTVKALLQLITSEAFPRDFDSQYQDDVYESFFHIAFARRKFDQAEEILKRRSSEDPTHCRHLAKLYLAKSLSSEFKIDFTQDIEDNLWESYDANKKRLRSSLKKIKHQARSSLLKDFILLFNVRCQKSLLRLDKGRKPYKYVLEEVEKVFSSHYTLYLFENGGISLKEKLASIEDKEYLFVYKWSSIEGEEFYLGFVTDGVANENLVKIVQKNPLYMMLRFADFKQSTLTLFPRNPMLARFSELFAANGMKMPAPRKDHMYFQVKKLLDEKINLIRETLHLPLDYSYFSEAVPSIVFTRDQVSTLFGEGVSANNSDDRREDLPNSTPAFSSSR